MDQLEVPVAGSVVQQRGWYSALCWAHLPESAQRMWAKSVTVWEAHTRGNQLAILSWERRRTLVPGSGSKASVKVLAQHTRAKQSVTV
jgi:hypothetical protein